MILKKKSWGGENALVALPRSCSFLNSALAIKATELCPGLFKTPLWSFVVFALRSSLHLCSVTPCRKYKLPNSQKAVHFFFSNYWAFQTAVHKNLLTSWGLCDRWCTEICGCTGRCSTLSALKRRAFLLTAYAMICRDKLPKMRTKQSVTSPKHLIVVALSVFRQ